MIAKHIAMRSQGKSDFAGLVQYITDAQSKSERLGRVRLENCQASGLQDAIAEVLATQMTNKRAKGDKTYHLLVSFRARETPNERTLAEIEARLCGGLGFAEHQRVSAVHHDTDNVHLHIAINKIHPARHTLHEPYYPHRTLAELCTLLEREYGLEPDNHVPRQRGAGSRAADMEHHAGVESLVGWIRRGCLEALQGAQTWKGVHQALAEHGLTMYGRGNGLVIDDGNGIRVRASTVARELSRARLESRLGPFLPDDGFPRKAAVRRYLKQPLPLRSSTVELYARFQTEQGALGERRTHAMQAARQHKERSIAGALRNARLRRAMIRTFGGGALAKRMLYAQATRAARSEIQKAREEYARQRKSLYASWRRLSWADWLRQEALQGNAEALEALRARPGSRVKGDVIQVSGRTDAGPSPAIDNITKKGTVIYRAGPVAVRDDGDRLQVSRHATPEALDAALRLALDRYGSRISVGGTDRFKARIVQAAVRARLPVTFAESPLENMRQALLTREKLHERGQQGQARAGRSVAGPGRRGAPYPAAHGFRLSQPDSGSIGSAPPPAARHRLRSMSELGVVRVASRTQVLLPGDVSRHVEQPRARRDYALRRGVSLAAVDGGAMTAARKYVQEREAKRSAGIDIPRHCVRDKLDQAAKFAGIRTIDGHVLALFDVAKTIMVVPVESEAARHLRRLAVGDEVTVTAEGAIRGKRTRSR